MSLFDRIKRCGTAVLLSTLIGCTSGNGRTPSGYLAAPPVASRSTYAPPASASPTPEMPASPVAYQVAADEGGSCDPFAGQTELSIERLVAEVQMRNPSLQAASAAWRAAAQRYPQVVSLDDPMFGWMVSPRGVGSEGGWMAEASQKIPWAGKRGLRGDMAHAEADAAQAEADDTRLMLAEAAKMAFFDYYLARRQLEVNASTTELVRQFREIAKTKYEASQATQQDVLQAEVELADLEARRAGFARDERIAIARINTLLHRAADCPLPPPPTSVTVPATVPAAELLQNVAAQSRPDLYAQAARVRAAEAAVELANKEFNPDVEIVGKYDAFMPEDMRPQLGMRLNVPLQQQRRTAAVEEAQARLCRQRAEYQIRLDRARFEVQSAMERLTESQNVVQLYTARILPISDQNLQSARANYVANRADFLRLIDAQRQLNEQREKHFQAVADYHRRGAELERAVGGQVPPDGSR